MKVSSIKALRLPITMLNSNEQKVVVSTLTKRRAWLKNSLSDNKLDKAVRSEYVETLQTLDSAMKKLSAITKTPATAAPASKKKIPPVSNKEPKKNTFANTRILIAEDSKDASTLLNEFLQDIGFKLIDLAEDGIEAFEKIKGSNHPFDLILCDWDMPGLSGLEVHEKAKASNTLKGAHFMMVTAVSESDRIRKAIQQGVNDYIVKPLDLDALETKIKTALNIQEDKPQQEEKPA